jgi:hypothetical protein
MNLRHAVFLIVGIAALILIYPHSFQYMDEGGNFFNIVEFFAAGIEHGGAAAALSIEMFAVCVVFWIWVIADSHRIRLGAKWDVFFTIISYVGISFFFPLYLILRERYLARTGKAGC